MLLPLMLTLYLGGVEVSQGISIDRKVTLTARTVADLVAQVSSINIAGLTSVLDASTAMLAPYPEGPAKIDCLARQHRCAGRRQDHLEPGQERHGARGRLGRDHSGGAEGQQHLAGLG